MGVNVHQQSFRDIHKYKNCIYDLFLSLALTLFTFTH